MSQNESQMHFKSYENRIIVVYARQKDLVRVRDLLEDFPNDFNIISFCQALIALNDCTKVERLIASNLLAIPWSHKDNGRIIPHIPNFAPDKISDAAGNFDENDSTEEMDHLKIWVTPKNNEEKHSGVALNASVFNLEIEERYFEMGFEDFNSKHSEIPSDYVIENLFERLDASARMTPYMEYAGTGNHEDWIAHIHREQKQVSAYVRKITQSITEWMEKNNISANTHMITAQNISPKGGISYIEIQASPKSI